MRLKTLSSRARPIGRMRRRREARETKVHPVQPDAPIRVWSLLLPPGFPPDRR